MPGAVHAPPLSALPAVPVLYVPPDGRPGAMQDQTGRRTQDAEGEPFTYDTLRDLERLENTSPRLTKLEPRFWERLGGHLSSLRQAFQDQQEEDPTARRTVVLADELRNTQRLAESIWALREKKVVHAGLAAARRREGTKAAPEHATGEERDLFVATVDVLRAARDDAGITNPFGRRAAVAQHKGAAGLAPAAAAEETRGGVQGGSREGQAEGGDVVPVAGPAGGPRGPTQGGGVSPAAPQAAVEAPPLEGRGGVGGDGEQEVELRVVEALKEVPRFAGPDMVTYALAAGEVGNLPRKAAEILAGRGIVRILLETPPA